MGEAKKISSQVPSTNGWKKGTYVHKAGSTRRQASACKVTPSGQFIYNIASTDQLDHCCPARGITDKIYSVQYLTNLQEGKISFYPTHETGPGTVTIRRSKSGTATKIAYFQPGPFEDEPDLRPVTRVKAKVITELNPYDSLPMISIVIQNAPPHVSRSRKKKDDQQPAAAAAAVKK